MPSGDDRCRKDPTHTRDFSHRNQPIRFEQAMFIASRYRVLLLLAEDVRCSAEAARTFIPTSCLPWVGGGPQCGLRTSPVSINYTFAGKQSEPEAQLATHAE